MKTVLGCLALASAIATVSCSATDNDTPNPSGGSSGKVGATGGTTSTVGGSSNTGGTTGTTGGLSNTGGGGVASGGTTSAGNGGSAASGTGGKGLGGSASGGSASGGSASSTGGTANAGASSGGTAPTGGAAGTGGGGPIAGSCMPGRPKTAGTTTVMIQVGGKTRQYLLHIPTGYDGTKRIPAVVDIHGWSSWAAEQLQRSKWDKEADKQGFVLVEPDGINKSWIGGGLGGDPTDVQFFRDIAKKLTAELCVDDKRIYVTGHSNGGAMTYQLACEASDVFAAAAPVCGWLSGTCNPSRPIPLMAIRALQDGTVKIDTADADLNKFTSHNKCAATPIATSGVCKTRTSCDAGTQVSDCRPRGGHDFFYANNPDAFFVPEKAWAFFKQFSLP